jgi:hypothetical protein
LAVRLRAHHLLCLLTYAGRGYGPAFTAGLDAIADRVAAGEAILLVPGPDDICAPLLQPGVEASEAGAHCTTRRVRRRDRRALDALAPLLARPLVPGMSLALDASAVRRLRQAFAAGTIRAACRGCEWAPFCTETAADGFVGVRLRPTAPDRR